MVPYFENPKLTNVLPLKSGSAHDVAIHALSTAGSFFHVLISAFLVLLPAFFQILSLQFDFISFGWHSFLCGPAE